MLGLCGGLLIPPLTSWKDKPVDRESCPTAGSLQDEEGSPLISPSTDQHCNLAEGYEDAPEKSPEFTLSSLVHKQHFMVIQRG